MTVPNDTDPLADTQTGSAPASSIKRRSVGTGDTLGRYELQGEIGEGGMATVYKARDKELRRDVAVKVLFPHLARRDDVVRRFHREARAAAGLEHANILRVYDVGGGDTEDPPYIVMELIRGNSLLGEIERRGPMLAEIVACVGAVLADALVVAHAAGIIHRDIKPANVMVGEGGRVLLADFGVARLETEDSLVTKTGALLGTPAYMSPEQASGDTATAKSDVYSLGATLYQLATGSLPYAGSPAKILALIAAGQHTPAVKKRTEVGPDLSRVIDRCMAVEPAARPASAQALADELRALAVAAGFGEPRDELVQYFADPDAFIRARTPAIVKALVAAGNAALTEGKLPRAIALADRATALAPDDPAVVALVARVTEGDRSSRRTRMLALAGIGVLVAGGATFGAIELLGSRAPDDRDEPLALVAALDDGGAGSELIAGSSGDGGRGSSGDMTPGSGGDVPRGSGGGSAAALVRGSADIRDAGRDSARMRRDAGVSSRDAAISIDAAAQPAVAMPAGMPDAMPAAKPGYIVVRSDAWCDVTIDGADRGRANGQPIEVVAGTHTVACTQGTLGNRWSKRVTVAAGATAEATGSVLEVQITFAIDAHVNGVAYRAGQVVPMKGGRLDIDGKWVSVTRSCTVRRTPEIGCYP